jgi:hypothetical protein
LKTKKREEDIRASLDSLSAKNDMGGGFGHAASKSVIQELESEESEEDPDDDDEPEAPSQLITNTLNSVAEKPIWFSAPVPSTEPSDEVIGAGDIINVNIQGEFGPVLDILSIPDAVSTSAISEAVTLPATINPDEKDMIHTYNVNQRSERGDKLFETLVLASFHDLDEANAFAQQKTKELIYNPILSQIGLDETYDPDTKFIGRAINNKDEGNAELVWVSRVITYIGDVSNLSLSDIKPIRPIKVFNVLQTIRLKDSDPESEVIVTTTIKSLANQKAFEFFIAICKPLKPDIDQVQEHNSIVIPTVRAKLAEADQKDECLSLEGEDELSGRWFKVEVSECNVVGPLN